MAAVGRYWKVSIHDSLTAEQSPGHLDFEQDPADRDAMIADYCEKPSESSRRRIREPEEGAAPATPCEKGHVLAGRVRVKLDSPTTGVVEFRPDGAEDFDEMFVFKFEPNHNVLHTAQGVVSEAAQALGFRAYQSTIIAANHMQLTGFGTDGDEPMLVILSAKKGVASKDQETFISKWGPSALVFVFFIGSKLLSKFLRKKYGKGSDYMKERQKLEARLSQASTMARFPSAIVPTHRTPRSRKTAAIRNYEAFHKLPRGTATLHQVVHSSAGVAGWAAHALSRSEDGDSVDSVAQTHGELPYSPGDEVWYRGCISAGSKIEEMPVSVHKARISSINTNVPVGDPPQIFVQLQDPGTGTWLPTVRDTLPDRLSITDPNHSESDSDRSTSDEGSSEGSWNTLELSEDDWSDVGSASFGTESAGAVAEGASASTDHEWVVVRESQASQLEGDKRPDPSTEGPAAAAAPPLAMFDSEPEPEPESASASLLHPGEPKRRALIQSGV
jgi:hypothetical protein